MDSTFISAYRGIAWSFENTGKMAESLRARETYIAKVNYKFNGNLDSIPALELKTWGNALWEIETLF
ncbi:MAG: hypothetical protein IPN76_25465 [Saprospiraceae bacterium]|nr:hypothetical protein [Saprospiraceae bacterium]